MIIYIDLLFLLNVFLDFLLLMAISVMLVRNTKIKRLLLGSLIGGISTGLLFISASSFIVFILKITLGVVMVIATFGFHNIKYTLNNLFYLYTISFIAGGVMYLLMNKGYYNYFILIISFILYLYICLNIQKQI